MGWLTFCRVGVGQVFSNRTELKIPYTPSSRWYTMDLGAELVSSVRRGGKRGHTRRRSGAWKKEAGTMAGLVRRTELSGLRPAPSTMRRVLEQTLLKAILVTWVLFCVGKTLSCS